MSRKYTKYSTKILLTLFDKLGINAIFRSLYKNKAIILWYHGICDDDFQLLRGYDERHIPKSAFREQVIFLKRKGYIFSTMSELMDMINNRKKIGKLTVLTFDDGFRNVVENAYPIMKELNAKGCFYLVSSLIGGDKLLWTDYIETIVRNTKKGELQFIFKGEKINYTLDNKESYENTMLDIKDKLRSIPDKKRIEHLKQFKNKKIDDIPREFLFANWKQIQNLDRRILEIGGHSKTHPDLPTLYSNEDLKEEIKESKVDIEKKINYEIIHFNYPAGEYNKQIIERIKKDGYKSAVTTLHGFNDENTNPYRLKRIEPTTDFLLFKSSISGSFLNLFRIKEFFRIKIRNPIFGIMKILRKPLRIPIVLARIGFLHSFRLIYIYFVSSLVIKILPIYLKYYVKAKIIIQKYYYANKEIRYWQQNKEEILKLGKKGYITKIEDLGLNKEKLEFLKKVQRQSHEVVIGEIDQDGFLLLHFGKIRDAPMVDKRKFLKRKVRDLKLVDINGYVGVKKNYKGNKLAFVTELKAIHNLRFTGCNVPSIIDIDFDNLALTISYIKGPVLREELARRGAVLRDYDVDDNPDFMYLGLKEKDLKRIKEGKRVLYDVIGSQFVEDLFTELKKIHEAGFIYNDLKYGNIIIEKNSGKPYLVDFERAYCYPYIGKNSFTILRDQNIEEFNLLFDTKKLTYKRVKERIKEIKDNNAIYAPIYFGAGLRIGKIWTPETGYGRWHYILKRNLPPISGKRILDIGTNNASIALELLRNGAQKVIGVELDSENIAQGNFVKTGYDWADNTHYNFKYIQADMKEIPAMNLGKFDMALALCSLYYLDDDSIANLTKYISTITDIFVLQCNLYQNVDRGNPHTYRRASIDYALNVLRSNGFPITQVIAPFRYTRPLVIGKKEK